jgi:sugar fermentation stimulation protein A
MAQRIPSILILEAELHDRGSYLLILRVASDEKLKVGGLSEIKFCRGYYVYVGSAMKNLTQRIERHRRLRKNLFWHIDYLRDSSEFLEALPVRSEDDLECEIADGMRNIADWTVPGFGSSDCSCPSLRLRNPPTESGSLQRSSSAFQDGKTY